MRHIIESVAAHKIMLRAYGNAGERMCQECSHWRRVKRHWGWRDTCDKATVNDGSSWDARWQACGRFEEIKRAA